MSAYARAKNEAYRQALMGQRHPRCLLAARHDPHVFRAAGRDNGCGGAPW